MVTRRKPDTPAQVILGVLVYEFRPEDRSKSEETVKRRLRYYRVGSYDQNQVDLLRRFKESLAAEISLRAGSRYYLGPHGTFAALEDFDVERMVADYHAAFPDVGVSEIEWFVPFALYVYYLR